MKLGRARRSVTERLELIVKRKPSPSFVRSCGLVCCLAIGLDTNSLRAQFPAAGSVVAWGYNHAGTATAPLGLNDATALAGGEMHSMALRANGLVTSWGASGTPAGLSNVTAIAAGQYFSLALTKDGSLSAWGDNFYGQISVPPGLSNAVSIGCGWNHALAVLADNTVLAWGRNSYGQTNVPQGLRNVIAVGGGMHHSAALKADGTVVAWGANYAGQSKVPTGLSNAVSLAVGAEHVAVLKADGSMTVWGNPLANQDNIYSGLSNLVAVASGGFHVLALKMDASIVSWGFNDDGQANVPLLIHPVGIAAGRNHSMAIFGQVPPFASGPFPNRGAFIGSNAYFHAPCRGTKPLYFQWRLNGSNIPGATNATLALSNLRLDQAGRFSVVASNIYGTFVSDDSLLNLIPIAIASPPKDQQIFRDETALFEVIAEGAAPFFYQWLLDDKYLPAETNANLVLTNAQFNQAGYYSVIVSNFHGSVTSEPAELRVVPMPLSISSQPSDQWYSRGGTAFFNVLVEGSDPFHFQWRMNGTNLPFATNAVLSLSNTVWSDKGGYSVVVSSPFMSITSRIAYLREEQILPFGSYLIPGGPTPRMFAPTNLLNVLDISSGSNHGLALQCDGSVIAWGNNQDGQINVPPSLTNVVAISAGGDHNIVLLKDGTVLTWGSNRFGQNDVPSGLSFVASVAAGANHNMALMKNGTVVAWGDNGAGQTNVPPGLTNVVAIAAGSYHSLALKADGTIVGWGYNNYGQAMMPLGMTNVIDLAAGHYHSVSLQADGLVTVWGSAGNDVQNLPPGLQNVLSVKAGPYSTLVLHHDAKAVASGDINIFANYNELTALSAGYRHAFALKGDGPPALGGSVLSRTIIGGKFSFFRIRATGAHPLSYQWLFNGLPIGGATNATYPISYTTPDHVGTYSVVVSNSYGTAESDLCNLDIVPFEFSTHPQNCSVLLGQMGTLSVSINGTGPFSYQWFHEGSILPGATNATLSLTNLHPSQVGRYFVVASNAFGHLTSEEAMLSGIVLTISQQPHNLVCLLGSSATFSVSAEGTGPFAYQWQFQGTDISEATNAMHSLGAVTWNSEGDYGVIVENQFGAVTSALARLDISEVLVWPSVSSGQADLPLGVRDILTVSAGGYHSLAIRTNGTVFAWGRGTSGQTEVPSALEKVLAVAGGAYYSLALQSDGTVVGWGDNSSGQVDVPLGLADVAAVAAARYHNLVLRSNGTVFAWGNNQYGQTNVPLDLTDVVAIACGWRHNLALRANGTVAAWGRSTYGATATPSGLSNVVAIAGGGNHSLALLSDGTVVAWGDNQHRQTDVPLGLSNVVNLSAGYYHSMALLADGSLVSWGMSSSGQTNTVDAITNVVAISTMGMHSLALVGPKAPFIGTALLNRTASYGEDVFFYPSIIGARPLSFQWRFNGVELSGESNAWLSLRNVQLKDAGYYSVAVNNVYGTALSAEAHLSVIPAEIRFDASDSQPYLTNGFIHMRVTGPSGLVVILDASNELPNWLPLQTNTFINGSLVMQLPVIPDGQRFFRLRAP